MGNSGTFDLFTGVMRLECRSKEQVAAKHKGEGSMKLVTAIIKPFKLEEVRQR